MKSKYCEIIELTSNNIPCEEVIAIGHQNECLVGYIFQNEINEKEFICESEESILYLITHYINIPKV